ncbi:phage tail protein [Pseudomonas qingdaonensis]|nr:phage tail protein [Pseudomonas qingdaonensis]
MNNIPPGWLEVDNSAKSIAAYPDLAAFLGGAYNNGTEPAGYFRLPESRGTVLRGWDHGRGVDAARQLSTEQLDAVQSIAGKLTFRGFAPGSSGSVYTADGPFTLNIAGGTNSPYTTSLLSGAVPRTR